MECKDGKFWEQFILTLKKDWETSKLFMWTDGRYFSDFAKKIPNADLTKTITINPYDFTGDNGKQIRWMTITQDWTKLENYYWDGKKLIFASV